MMPRGENEIKSFYSSNYINMSFYAEKEGDLDLE